MSAPNHKNRLRIPLVCVAIAALVTLAAAPAASAESALETFDRNYERLVDESPADARLPYARALLLVQEHRYGEAADFTRRSLAKSSRNLDAWKLDIWLRLRNEDFGPALDRVERLARHLPSEDAPEDRRRRGDQTAHFFGEVCGYLAGPREADVSPDFDYRVERLVAGLTRTQSAAFDRGLQGVMSRFASLSDDLAEARRQHIEAAYQARQSRMGEIVLERDRLRGELASLDTLRLQGMKIAADERNTLAATRERAAGGSAVRQHESYNAESQREAFSHRGPRYQTKRLIGVGPGGGVIAGDSYAYQAPDLAAGRFTGVEAYRGATNAASGYAYSKGFGTRHYVDVNDREKDYETRLTRRRTSMMKQLRNLAREEKELLGEPPTGDSTRIARLRRKAERLATYLPLPVDLEEELRELKS